MVIRIIQIVITGTSGFQTPYWNRISLSPPTLLCLVYRRRRLPPSSPVAAAGRSGREGGDIIISQREAHTTAQGTQLGEAALPVGLSQPMCATCLTSVG
uniref:Uncharacterized protein n=1 Tax=Oryza punctata TaxID=4537 RepID=A0A0E0JRM9_ORYPU